MPAENRHILASHPVLCKPNTLPTKEMRLRATEYSHWQIMFIAWTECAFPYLLPLSTPLIPLPFTCNGRGTHRFAPTTEPQRQRSQ
jgi:hypothetical protein